MYSTTFGTITAISKQTKARTPAGNTGDDDMNRDELLTKLAMEHAPDEWGDAATWTYDEHQFGWNEYQLRRTELINRPSWDDAPEWAEWLAQDEVGRWMWYGDEPFPVYDAGKWQPEFGTFLTASRGATLAGHDWRDTLEPRPQTQSDIKTWWTSKTCTECGRTTAAKVSDDNPVCPECVSLGPDISDGGPDVSSGQYARATCGSDADSILSAAVRHMRDRAATYDKPQGERSMGATVAAFRATTGVELTEEQGWHFMALLKLVRSQQGELRMDSYEDGAAYMALAGEAAARGRG